MVTPPVDLVRRAIERAIEVARAGQSSRPVVPVPPALRPVLRFKRLPAQALLTVANVLDTDDEFRARVAAAIERDDVGRVAWLWITRPSGWDDELPALIDELDADPVPPERERDADKALRRRVEGAERAAARATERAGRAEAELDRVRHELADAREAHAALDARLGELDASAASLAAERRTAVSELKRVEALLARRTDERRALEHQLAALEARPDPPPVQDHVDARELRRVVERLSRHAAAFAGELDTLRAALGAEPPPPAARSSPKRHARRATAIPGGLTEDSEQAAAHLVSRSGAVLLVDGYNVSMSAWPDLDIAEQRQRLERALADLAARTPGLAVELIFDGAEVLPLARTGARRVRGVTVRFTAPDVEADDALLELADGYPHDRAVIVVSDDRRVRDGARRRGANVLTAAQLLALARG
jgi:predicted RNA-binding protein with PIN domain